MPLNFYPPFDALPSTDTSCWKRFGLKTNGHNAAGQYGAFYSVTMNNGNTKKVFLKQDPEQEKNIIEVFSSQFMRFVAEEIGENPDIIANVNYVDVQSNHIYVASEIFENYRDLFLDAYLAYQLPCYAELRSVIAEEWQNLPTSRPSFLQHDVPIDTMMIAGRYNDLIPGLALRAVIDDPDLHFENIGAVPINNVGSDEFIPIIINGQLTNDLLSKIQRLPTDPPIKINNENYYKYPNDLPNQPFEKAAICHNNTYYIIPNMNNTRAVGIDFGGALGDFRLLSGRKFDKKIHISKFLNFIRYLPSRSGPPSYMNQINPLLNEGNEFFHTLARFSMIKPEKIKIKIDHELDRVLILYNNHPKILIQLAERIGVKIPTADKKDSNRIIPHIKTFLYNNMIARQQHAKTLFLKNFCRLNRPVQNNLMNICLANKEELPLKHQLMVDFFSEIKSTNQELFNGFNKVDQLSDSLLEIPNIGKAIPSLTQLQAQLHKRLCSAYLNNNLPKVLNEINRITANTTELINDFKTTNALLASDKSDLEKENAVNNFLKRVSNYEKQCLETSSTSTQVIIAACAFLGTLTGIILGAALGLFVGGLVGGVLGNIVGAVTAGSAAAVTTAMNGAGIGAAVGASVGGMLLGVKLNHSFGQLAKHSLLAENSKPINQFTDDLKDITKKSPKI